ncbi:MAG: Ig-like domain repeat protein [Thaumarchaeota archaeon]|nr:Ig-like domain repeat protein [Nitrososphaerota archaeon]
MNCSPPSMVAGSSTDCTATVAGSSPTGDIFWNTNSGTGLFSTPSCHLSAGSCSTSYSDSTPGTYTIVANYLGDSNNSPSSRSASLTVTSASTITTSTMSTSTTSSTTETILTTETYIIVVTQTYHNTTETTVTQTGTIVIVNTVTATVPASLTETSTTTLTQASSGLTQGALSGILQDPVTVYALALAGVLGAVAVGYVVYRNSQTGGKQAPPEAPPPPPPVITPGPEFPSPPVDMSRPPKPPPKPKEQPARPRRSGACTCAELNFDLDVAHSDYSENPTVIKTDDKKQHLQIEFVAWVSFVCQGSFGNCGVVVTSKASGSAWLGQLAVEPVSKYLLCEHCSETGEKCENAVLIKCQSGALSAGQMKETPFHWKEQDYLVKLSVEAECGKLKVKKEITIEGEIRFATPDTFLTWTSHSTH